MAPERRILETHCPSCNLLIPGVEGLTAYCRCGTTYTIEEKIEFWKHPGTAIKRFLQEKQLVSNICVDCGRKAAQMNAWGVPGCLSNIDKIVSWVRVKGDEKLELLDAIAEILYMGRSESWCSQPHLIAASRKARMEPPKFPEVDWDVMEDDAVVVSATDEGMIRGAYIMAYTCLAANDVDLVIYDLGIRNKNLMEQMKSWGVTFLPPPEIYGRGIEGWQTWNKPAYIEDQLKQGRAVTWIDADAAVAWPLTEPFDFTWGDKFIVDHGWHDTMAMNDPALQDHLGPHTYWEGARNPCAGVCGFRGTKDLKFVMRWKHLCKEACENSFIRRWYALYDQGALAAALALEGFDNICRGFTYNDMRGKRVLNPQQLVDVVYGSEVGIKHFGGAFKPWKTWKDTVFNFGHPHSIRRRYDNHVSAIDCPHHPAKDWVDKPPRHVMSKDRKLVRGRP